MKLVLASGSPRRRELIQLISDNVEIQVSSVDEDDVVNTANPKSPEEMVMILAEAKARDVAKSITEQSLVIGADTIVWLDDKALNKPVDKDDALRMLLSLGGRQHHVYTGLAIVPAGDCILRPAYTGFFPITTQDALDYIATGEPMDKAGSYGIQDSSIGKRFVKSVDGDFNNVVGLPVDKLREMLKEFGIGL
jgi:septum formation protein